MCAPEGFMTARFGILFAVFSLAAVAQNAMPKVVVAQGTMGGVVGVAGGMFVSSGPGLNPFQPITGHPYSAEQVTEHVQTLADGTHITQTNQRTLLYRDSEGRTRTEHIFTPPPGAVATNPRPAFVEIADPVAGYRYILNERDHTARRFPWQPQSRAIKTLPARVQGGNAPAASTPGQGLNKAAYGTRPHPEMTHEDLGTQTIEGVLAEGKRMTTTFPEGFFGNDRPITTVSETWVSPDLHVVVLSKYSDPRSGDSTTELKNLSLNEPDASLFQIPADYTVTDQSN
jgi:hypothetical protein